MSIELNDSEKGLARNESSMIPAIRALRERLAGTSLLDAKTAVEAYRHNPNRRKEEELARTLAVAYSVLARMADSQHADISNKARLYILNTTLDTLREILPR